MYGLRAVAGVHLIIFFMQIQGEPESDGNLSVSGAWEMLWASRECKKCLTTTQMCGRISEHRNFKIPMRIRGCAGGII